MLCIPYGAEDQVGTYSDSPLDYASATAQQLNDKDDGLGKRRLSKSKRQGRVQAAYRTRRGGDPPRGLREERPRRVQCWRGPTVGERAAAAAADGSQGAGLAAAGRAAL